MVYRHLVTTWRMYFWSVEKWYLMLNSNNRKRNPKIHHNSKSKPSNRHGSPLNGKSSYNSVEVQTSLRRLFSWSKFFWSWITVRLIFHPLYVYSHRKSSVPSEGTTSASSKPKKAEVRRLQRPRRESLKFNRPTLTWRNRLNKLSKWKRNSISQWITFDACITI